MKSGTQEKLPPAEAAAAIRKAVQEAENCAVILEK